jgi:uncharacterized protein YndB with AHSA1/START domain
VLTRLFDAPRQIVVEAMTRPEHVRRWWGALDERFSMPICEIDRREGARGASSAAARTARTASTGV